MQDMFKSGDIVIVTDPFGKLKEGMTVTVEKFWRMDNTWPMIDMYPQPGIDAGGWSALRFAKPEWLNRGAEQLTWDPTKWDLDPYDAEPAVLIAWMHLCFCVAANPVKWNLEEVSNTVMMEVPTDIARYAANSWKPGTTLRGSPQGAFGEAARAALEKS